MIRDWKRRYRTLRPPVSLIQKPRFLDPLKENTKDRRFFVCGVSSGKVRATETECFGLCDPDARVGDEVWILQGGRVPFTLRSESTAGLDGKQ